MIGQVQEDAFAAVVRTGGCCWSWGRWLLVLLQVLVKDGLKYAGSITAGNKSGVEVRSVFLAYVRVVGQA